MQRMRSVERPGWRQLAEQLGFGFHTMYGAPYWDETAYYQFTLAQIERDLEAPTEAIHQMAMALVEEAVRDEALLIQLGIPSAHWDLLRESWQRRDPAMYARLDLAYDGHGPAKLYELNYDTPTSLYESAFFQWVWLEQMQRAGALPAAADQFNSIQDRLEAFFAETALRLPVHFAAIGDNEEDCGTVAYLRDIATQARCPNRFLPIEQIGVDSDGQFVDEQDERIATLFKLYPWEDLLQEPFAEHLHQSQTRFIEPPWKLILSNKAALALLWQRHPGHPNLLPTYFDEASSTLPAGWVRKPFFSREGANVQAHLPDGRLLQVDGPYGHYPCIRQAWHPAPCFDGNYTVLGSWLVGDVACGIGIREDASHITQDLSRFLPHIILD
ncbi:MAG TPA: glutathionylspermidine synthase family protein [Permianibacter sp.]|nr:glutathionylspermidine synthase family protein [Permianibacter sp.]